MSPAISLISSLAPVILPALASAIPAIINAFHAAHPVPADATPAVKADINSLKQTGAVSTASTILGQMATAGKVTLPSGVSATDPAITDIITAAVEQAYQMAKSNGTLPVPTTAAAVAGTKVSFTGTMVSG